MGIGELKDKVEDEIKDKIDDVKDEIDSVKGDAEGFFKRHKVAVIVSGSVLALLIIGALLI